MAVAIGLVQEQLVRAGLMTPLDLDDHTWHAKLTLDEESREVVTVFCNKIPRYGPNGQTLPDDGAAQR